MSTLEKSYKTYESEEDSFKNSREKAQDEYEMGNTLPKFNILNHSDRYLKMDSGYCIQNCNIYIYIV